MSDYWFDRALQHILVGNDPLDVIGSNDHPDPKERWYSEALAMMLRAMYADGGDPTEVLIGIQEMGFPDDDILHVAQLFEVLLTALYAAHILTHHISESDIQAGAADLISGVEDYLRNH